MLTWLSLMPYLVIFGNIRAVRLESIHGDHLNYPWSYWEGVQEPPPCPNPSTLFLIVIAETRISHMLFDILETKHVDLLIFKQWQLHACLISVAIINLWWAKVFS